VPHLGEPGGARKHAGTSRRPFARGTASKLPTKATCVGLALQIAFNATTGIYVKNHTIDQIDAGDVLFA
jgi:hypothetical protein